MEPLYPNYNLKINPFLGDSPDYEMINRKSIMSRLARTLNMFIPQESPKMYTILGNYGVGKTYVLLQLKKKIEEDDAFLKIEKEKLLSVYIKSISPKPPSSYMHFIYSEIMKSLGEKKLIELSQKIVNSVEQELHTGKSKIKTNIDTALFAPFCTLCSRFKNIALPYIIGKPISAPEMKEIGARLNLSNDDNARTIFIEFLKLLKLLNYEGLIILIDEFEYIFTAAGDKKIAQLITTFKDLYDNVNEIIQGGGELTKPIFLFACTPTVWTDSLPKLTKKVGQGGLIPFIERMFDTQPLDPFGIEETRDLLISRLDKRRIHFDKQTGLFPFKEDYVAFIREQGAGYPRKILTTTAFILDESDNMNIKPIGKDEAYKILDKYNMLS